MRCESCLVPCCRTKMALFAQAGRDVRLLCVHGHYADAAEARRARPHSQSGEFVTNLCSNALTACFSA